MRKILSIEKKSYELIEVREPGCTCSQYYKRYGSKDWSSKYGSDSWDYVIDSKKLEEAYQQRKGELL